jgi:hypothetical protein
MSQHINTGQRKCFYKTRRMKDKTNLKVVHKNTHAMGILINQFSLSDAFWQRHIKQ